MIYYNLYKLLDIIFQQKNNYLINELFLINVIGNRKYAQLYLYFEN